MKYTVAEALQRVKYIVWGENDFLHCMKTTAQVNFIFLIEQSKTYSYYAMLALITWYFCNLSTHIFPDQHAFFYLNIIQLGEIGSILFNNMF